MARRNLARFSIINHQSSITNSPRPSPLAPRPSAFTLVELLVVIAIIGILMALLFPAVQSVIATAKVTRCAHRMGELGKAMIAYETTKQHFPGYVNNVHGNSVSWAVVLLPYIGRNDLWEGPVTGNPGWRGGNTTNVGPIDLFVCPADSPTTASPLSFVVALGSSTASVYTSGASATGVFRDLTNPATKSVSTSDVKSSSLRPMIVENSCVFTSPERQWSLVGANVTPSMFGFVWPPSNFANRFVVAASVSDGSWSNGEFIGVGVIGAFPTLHPGQRLNITFCDGSAKTITRTDSENPTDTTMRCNKFDCTELR